MKNWDIAVIICGVLYLLSIASAKKGFLLTSPKTLDAGSTAYVTFTAFDSTSRKGALRVSLLNWYTHEMIANATADVVANLNQWVELSVPSSASGLRARLQVTGSFGSGEKEVRVRSGSVLTFVQTDKPIYKPGQMVRFRVLPLDTQLKPLPPDTVADIWIEDPSNIRVSQWKQVKFTEGMVQLELPLSAEPPLGEWSVHVIVRQVTHAQKFHVQKYVLPKFDVKIAPPPFIMADADSIPLEICAWYSYGKQVTGTFKMKAAYKRYVWEDERYVPSVEQSGRISGCQTVHVNTQDILLQTREFGFRKLVFFAEVTENATALTMNASATSEITHLPLKLEFLGSDRGTDHFKPGIPFYGALSARKPNGDPAANERIEICAEYQTGGPTPPPFPFHSRRFERSFYFTPDRRRGPTAGTHCHAFTTDRKGRVRFSVPPKSTLCTRITLKALAVGHPSVPYREGKWDRKFDQPSASLSLLPWHTPSGHQVQIQPHFDPVECGAPMRVRIRFTPLLNSSHSVKFYHQVTSRGRIVEQGSHRRLFHPGTHEEGIPRMFDLGPANPGSPTAGEFWLKLGPRTPWGPAARLLVFYVQEDGEVVADSRKFSVAHCLPNKVQLHFRHEQQSPGTDASLLLSAEPHSVCGIGLVDKSVQFLGRKNRFSKENVFAAISKLDVGREAAPHQVSEDYCQKKGGIVFPTPSHHFLSETFSLHSDSAMAFEEAGLVVVSNFEVETRPCEEMLVHGPVMLVDRLVPPPGSPGIDAVNLVSRIAPESPPGPRVMEVEDPPPKVVQEEEEKEIRSFFPETWLWEMHTVGASGESALIRRLPDTVTQWVGGAVCVHPHAGLGVGAGAEITAFRPFFVALALPYAAVTGEGVPITVTVFNYLEECLPIKLTLEPSPDFSADFPPSHALCVCGGASSGHRFTVRPRTPGHVNVTVYAFSMAEDRDGTCGSSGTARLSARDAVTRQLLVEAEGFPKEEVFNYFVCPETTNGSYAAEVDLLLPEDVVEGSERAFVSVTGDLLGPSIAGGLGKLVRMPVGCGEQNMALFTPNVLVLDYLRATTRLTPELHEQCVQNMKTGYQRQLQYRHPDGSFSAFGPRGSGEGGGSLWLTAFVVRSLGLARKHVDVDERDLGMSTAWVLSKQFENGCFEPAGFMLNKAMKGGLESGVSLAPLTAYVIISLLESGARRPGHPSVTSALSCMGAEPAPSTYAMALFAYAAVLAKEDALAEKYLRQLDHRALVKGSQRWWPESGGGVSVEVETAGYYVLARMSLEGREGSGAALPVVRWMAGQRNAHGGFVSTQDTVVALQALALYSSVQQTSRLDMGLALEGDEMVRGFRLDEESRLVTQTARVPVLPALIDMQAVGEGCALVQFTLRYNVARIAASQAFDLDVSARRVGSSSCNQPTIKICTRYRILEQTSNMVVVSVKMASGFVADEWSLFELESDPNVRLMRHEVAGNEVNLYFNELTNAEKCFAFHVKRELEVDDIKPASVKLYDYYQPELEITKEYTIPSVCTTTSIPSLPTLLPVSTAAGVEGTTTSEPTPHQETIGTETSEIHQELAATTEADHEDHVTEVATDTAETYPEIETAVSDNIAQASENPTSKLDYASTGTDIPGDIPQASKVPASEAFDATSTNSERLVTDESEMEVGTDGTTTTTEASEELATAEAEESAKKPEDLATTDETTAKTSVIDASSRDFSKIGLDGEIDDNLSEMADDTRIFETNEYHLSNFVSRENDLDFPEGIEGNMPVTVLPPNKDIRNVLTDAPNIIGCPVCVEEFPENFTEIYCSSASTLRISVRNAVSARILHDLSRHLLKPGTAKKFVKLQYDRRCRCPQLMERGSSHLVLGGRDLLKADEIRLTDRTIVVSTSSGTARLEEARAQCPANPSTGTDSFTL